MKVLQKLIEAYGVSGNEEHVREIIREEISKYVDDVFVDKSGNLIARKKGKSPKVMLAAHMDEVGLMIKRINPDGKIAFSSVGGIAAVSILGQRVKIHTEKGSLYGVITTKEMSNGEPVAKLPTLKEMYIDAGLGKQDLEKKGVEIGDYLNLVQESGTLGNSDIIYGKALDDRIGCYILIELARRLKASKSEIYFVFTVQEEIGLYGAKASAYELDPDWAIVVDVMDAKDADGEPSIIMGNGPCITVKDELILGNKCINKWLTAAARKKKLIAQLNVADSGITDAVTISLSKSGVPTSVVGIPVRNLHTTVGIAHRNDIEGAITLLEALLTNPPKQCIV
ncbi:MAG TPA: M42 family metallopeptidase [archaeon]|nr:M42 family metallopeptidase [archaeon]